MSNACPLCGCPGPHPDYGSHAELGPLVEALRFYANPAIYALFRQSTEHPIIMDEGEAYQDAGARAREVLAQAGLGEM